MNTLIERLRDDDCDFDMQHRELIACEIERLEKEKTAALEAAYHEVEKVVTLKHKLEGELEAERIRHAACGVIALSNTLDSAKQARQMKDEYWSASCADVANAVDREMALRDKLAECEAREAKLREALDLAKGRMMTLSACVFGKPDACKYMVEALALPADDTALKGYRKKLLDNYLEVMRNVFEEQGMDWPLFETLTTELRRMAEG